MLKEDGSNIAMMNNYTALVIGCGKIAGIYDDPFDASVYSHAKGYNSSKLFEKIYYCDIDIDKAKKIASIYGSEFYGDDMLQMTTIFRPDVISICTDTQHHFDNVMSILNLNYLPKLIFLEKPVCDNAEQLKLLIKLSNDKGVKIIVNHSRRFDPKMMRLRNLIAENFFGAPVKINVNYYGGWKNNGTHVIDTISYLFNRELDYVKRGNIENSRHLNDPTIDFHLRFKNSIVDIYINGFSEEVYQIFEFEFRFDKSRLRIEDFGSRLIYEKMLTNHMQEKVLEIGNINVEMSLLSPMENAMNIIGEYLNGNVDRINGLTINDISKTMNFVWQNEK